MAALTTLTAGACLLPSHVLAYVQIGTFIVVIMGSSLVYSTFFFPSLATSSHTSPNHTKCPLPQPTSLTKKVFLCYLTLKAVTCACLCVWCMLVCVAHSQLLWFPLRRKLNAWRCWPLPKSDISRYTLNHIIIYSIECTLIGWTNGMLYNTHILSYYYMW